MEFTGLQRLLQHTLVIVACLCVPGAPAWAQDKQPVPDAAALARAQKLVRDVYGKEYDEAKTPNEKTELAEKLLDQAAKSKGDPAGHFVLLRVAKDVSVLASDAKTALDAVERIVATYDIDVMEIRLDCVKRLAAAAKLSSQYGALAEQAQFLIDVALADDDFETASQFGEIARESARRARNYSLLRGIVARIKRCEELQQEHAEYRKAIARLEGNPTDPEANLTAGRYLSLSKGDWERGIPLLALGSDAALKAAATQELADPADPVAQIELADRWYDLAESAEKKTKTALLRHVGSWYKRAEPNVTTALQKAKLTRRLEEIEKIERSLTEVVVRPSPPSNSRPPVNRVRLRVQPQNNLAVKVYEKSVFETELGEQFPASNNKAQGGAATSSSSYPGHSPLNVFRGLRTGTSWTLKGPRGGFGAQWAEPPVGRYIVIFVRTTPRGKDPWGTAAISVNGGRPIPLLHVAGSTVVVVDIGQAAAIKSIAISINGKTGPGMAGLEIH